MFIKKSLESRSLGSATRIKEQHFNFNYLFYLFYLYLFITTLEFLTSREENFGYESGRNFKRREGIEINEMVIFSSLPEVMKHISRYEPGFRMSRRRRNKQQKISKLDANSNDNVDINEETPTAKDPPDPPKPAKATSRTRLKTIPLKDKNQTSMFNFISRSSASKGQDSSSRGNRF